MKPRDAYRMYIDFGSLIEKTRSCFHSKKIIKPQVSKKTAIVVFMDVSYLACIDGAGRAICENCFSSRTR